MESFRQLILVPPFADFTGARGQRCFRRGGQSFFKQTKNTLPVHWRCDYSLFFCWFIVLLSAKLLIVRKTL